MFLKLVIDIEKDKQQKEDRTGKIDSDYLFMTMFRAFLVQLAPLFTIVCKKFSYPLISIYAL